MSYIGVETRVYSWGTELRVSIHKGYDEEYAPLIRKHIYRLNADIEAIQKPECYGTYNTTQSCLDCIHGDQCEIYTEMKRDE